MIHDPLPFSLDRTVVIHAPREAVFRYFTDTRRFAAWWGAGSSIDPRPGGRVVIRYPNAVEAGGEVLSIEPPARIVFSYGYATGSPIAHGASRVTIALAEIDAGTRVELRHELADAAVRDEHVQGWRYQLAVFANVVADELFGAVEATVDAWFAAWAREGAARRDALAAIATRDVGFRDRYGCVDGLDELDTHVGAVQRFVPGVRLERDGPVQQCQGTAVARWVVRAPDGTERFRGTNVFELAPDGRISRVVGLWS
jgi:uncharacterized protein YndB with AHSA1/START domain